MSPVSITVSLIFIAFNSLIVFEESCFILSAINTYPTYFLSIATYNIVPTSSHFLKSIFSSNINFSFPTKISFSSILAQIPFPLNSCGFFMIFSSISLLYAFFTDLAIGWFE